jgi:N-acetyl sugar amidotransferase
MKREGRGRDYDCVIGVSGGVDSTYTAWLVRQLGLRPLAVHLDNGWDSNLAVSNIENCLKALSIDLYTKVLDWDEFRDLQLAFLKASTPDSEIPTDHAILAAVMDKADEIGVRYIVWGVNLGTEGLSIPTWSTGHFDWKYIRSVQERFGHVPLTSFPHFSIARLAYLRYVKRQTPVYLLNYVEYTKKEAEETIVRELGYRPYAAKHHESIYTRFFQSYILPRKFGFDKRRLHLACLVVSGQMSRAEALAELEKEVYTDEMARSDRRFVVKKLGLSEEEFDEILALPLKSFWDYPSYEKNPAVRAYRRLRRRRRDVRAARNGPI